MIAVLESSDFTVMAVLFVVAAVMFALAAWRWTEYPFVVAVGLLLVAAAFAWWSFAQT